MSTSLRINSAVQTNSSKGGYEKRGRRVYGPDYELSAPPAEAVEMTS